MPLDLDIQIDANESEDEKPNDLISGEQLRLDSTENTLGDRENNSERGPDDSDDFSKQSCWPLLFERAEPRYNPKIILKLVSKFLHPVSIFFAAGGTPNLILQFWKINTTYLPFNGQGRDSNMASSI